jgi:citrate lyase subunit beta/citryl-CoA lyase
MNNSHLYRTQLAIPANAPRQVADAQETDADRIFFDLEDSIHTSEKVGARADLVEALRIRDWHKPVGYRINSVRTRWWYEDIINVVSEVGWEVDSVIIPKVHSQTEVHTVETLLEAVEVNAGLDTGRIDILVQIEDATGIGNVERIVNASDRLAAVIFGPGDYSTSIGSRGRILNHNHEYPGHYWHYPLSRLSHAASSADLRAIDGLYTDTDDTDGFEKTCRYARMLGYDGKWVIHPDQTAVANQVFCPSSEEIERAKRIIEATERAGPDTVPTVGGSVVDKETISMARRILERARLAGDLE